jgi:hypothetical protein
MPREDAIIFSDLIGKLDVLHVHCAKGNRAGRCQVQQLIKDRVDEITANCPKKSAHNMNDQCAARCPDLSRVF